LIQGWKITHPHRHSFSEEEINREIEMSWNEGGLSASLVRSELFPLPLGSVRFQFLSKWVVAWRFQFGSQFLQSRWGHDSKRIWKERLLLAISSFLECKKNCSSADVIVSSFSDSNLFERWKPWPVSPIKALHVAPYFQGF
jgi:hypothetical protein